MKHVIVHIDRLVLKGFRPEDRHAIALGLQQELGRVFADREAVSLLKARGSTAQLQVTGVQIEHGLMPRRVGENVAQGIGKEIKK
ncbi:MAG: hypothetical protein ABI423_11535 [Burkholderiales bacterium]